jgi:ketosteroid isomerase-like protein
MQVIESWAAAVREADMAGVVANHTDDFVMFDVPEEFAVVRDLDRYRESWELFFGVSAGGPGSFDPKDIVVVAGDEVAFAYGFAGIGPHNVRLTVGLRKVDGRWLIAHEHHSYPSAV